MRAIKRSTALLAPVMMALMLASAPATAGIADVAQAMQMLERANKYMGKLDDGVVIVPPEPAEHTEGAYLLPYTADGALTAWAEKAMSAQAGAAVGSIAGDQASQAIASKVPFVGGFFGSKVKEKAEKTGAITAIGGMDFIKENSDRSFDSVEDMAVYMHVTYGAMEDYNKALAAATAVYPELEKQYHRAVKDAQKAANRAAR